MNSDHIEDHDRGLAYDLQTISRQMMERRRVLALFAGVGTTALLSGCGGDDATASSSGSTTATTGTTTTTTGTTSTTSTSTTTTTGSAQCIADPAETAGPYPGDGTNSASGVTSNVLTQSGVVRSDIRPSFINSTTVAAGIMLKITLTVVNVNNSCAPLAGYAVYLWQCDINGDYSLYGVPRESYLRGVLVTDSNGQVSFTTIFPACYSGRWPHMHFEIFSSIADATSGRNAILTSQLAMPADVCSTVFATSAYATSRTRFASVTLASDGIFGDNTSAQNAAMTPAMTGNVTDGYTATATIGVRI